MAKTWWLKDLTHNVPCSVPAVCYRSTHGSELGGSKCVSRLDWFRRNQPHKTCWSHALSIRPHQTSRYGDSVTSAFYWTAEILRSMFAEWTTDEMQKCREVASCILHSACGCDNGDRNTVRWLLFSDDKIFESKPQPTGNPSGRSDRVRRWPIGSHHVGAGCSELTSSDDLSVAISGSSSGPRISCSKFGEERSCFIVVWIMNKIRRSHSIASTHNV